MTKLESDDIPVFDRPTHSSLYGGSIQYWSGRGIFVPDGLSASEVVRGAQEIKKQYPDLEIGWYTAVAMAAHVLRAARS